MKAQILKIYEDCRFTPSKKLLDSIDRFTALFKDINTKVQVNIQSYDFDYSPEVMLIWESSSDNCIKVSTDDFNIISLEQFYLHMISYTTIDIRNREEFESIKTAFKLLNAYSEVTILLNTNL